MTFPGRLWLLGLALAGACASRSAPASYPTNAASSARAGESKPANVTMALSGEPPLPGDPTGAWNGLAEASEGRGTPATPAAPGDAADPHADHSQHGGHHHHGAH